MGRLCRRLDWYCYSDRKVGAHMREIKLRWWYEKVKRYIFANIISHTSQIGSQKGVDVSDPDYMQPAMTIHPMGVFVIEQFTGLNDKDGKEIYEGDIVEIEVVPRKMMPAGMEIGDTWNMQVKWISHGFELWMEGNKYSLFLPNLDNLRVVGNIHENPDLLEKQT